MSQAVGLIVNPVAGLGGPAALKGSDGMRELARAAGYRPRSGERAAAALRPVLAALPDLRVLTAAGDMGERVASACGARDVEVVTRPVAITTGADTAQAARAMAAAGVVLIMFAGGDGTARDMIAGAGQSVPVVGIPAGVKMQSAVFAVSPAQAARVAVDFLRQPGPQPLREVVDIDERAVREGRVTARLHGYLRVPASGRIQDRKSGSAPADEVAAAEIAATFAGQMTPGRRYVLGPGTTMLAVTRRLGLPGTLLGVDIVTGSGLVAADVTARRLAELATPGTVIAVSPVGGQGFLFGRGNQQIGADVLRRTGLGGIAVLCAQRKLAALHGAPLLIDSGDPAVDAALTGYVPVITGSRELTMYRTRGAGA